MRACGSVDTLPRFQCTGQRTKSQRDARMSIYVTGCPRQCMSNKDTQGCSALDPDQRTKYLRHAGMSIYVTGSPRQYMSNKDSQERSALVPKLVWDQVRPGLQDTRSEHDAGAQHWWACRLSLGLYAQAAVFLFCCFSEGEVTTYSNLPPPLRQTKSALSNWKHVSWKRQKIPSLTAKEEKPEEATRHVECNRKSPARRPKKKK